MYGLRHQLSLWPLGSISRARTRHLTARVCSIDISSKLVLTSATCSLSIRHSQHHIIQANFNFRFPLGDSSTAIVDSEHLRPSCQRSGNCRLKIARRRVSESLVMQSDRQETGARRCRQTEISISSCAGNDGSRLTIRVVQIRTHAHHIPSQGIHWPSEKSSKVDTGPHLLTFRFQRQSLARDLGRTHRHKTRQFRSGNFDGYCANG